MVPVDLPARHTPCISIIMDRRDETLRRILKENVKSRRLAMVNYIYGAATMFLFSTAVEVIDDNVHNSLWYHINLYLPF